MKKPTKRKNNLALIEELINLKKKKNVNISIELRKTLRVFNKSYLI